MAYSESKLLRLKANLPWLLSAMGIWIINSFVSSYLRPHVLALYAGSDLSSWMRSAGWVVVPLVMIAFVISVGAAFYCIPNREAKWQPYIRLTLTLFTVLGVVFLFACFVQLVIDV